MNHPLRYAATLLCLALLSCSETGTDPEEDLIVVRAYLFSGEPVQDIFLSSPVLIGDEATEGPPITDAMISLTRDGTLYPLEHNSARPGQYSYPGNDLLPGPGDVFSLDITGVGSHVSASTVVPPAPISVTANRETLKVTLETMDTPFGSIQRVTSDDTLLVSWSGNSEDLYYTIVRCIEENPSPLIVEEDTTVQRAFFFISPPVAQLQYRVQVQTLRYKGRHIVKVYHVNQEYADLYRSREQDSRNLNEPLTNIRGGLGAFSAFAADSVLVYVKLE